MSNPRTGLRGRHIAGTLSKTSRKKLGAQMMAALFSLPINANGTQSVVADHEGDLQSILFYNSAIGSGMTVDVLVNGVSILPSATPFAHSASYPAKTEISIPFVANTRILPGDIIAVTRGSFTAGASVARISWG